MRKFNVEKDVPDTGHQNDSFFQDFTKHDFEDWLRTGLEEYLLQHKGLQAFPGAVAELARYDFPAEALEAIYRRLSPNQQTYFRLAVTDLINSWEITRDNAVVWEHLLHLATLLPAREVLRGLPAWLRLGYFQSLPEKLAKELFDQVFLTVSRLVEPTPEAVQCLRELIALDKLFRTEWAGIALEALWFCDSISVTYHFQRLRPYLSQLMAGATHRPQTWARRILDKVGLYKIVQILPSLEYLNQINDTWLVEGLLACDPPLLECWVGEDGNLRFRLNGQQDTEELLLLEDGWNDLFAYLRVRQLMMKPLKQDMLTGTNYAEFMESLGSNRYAVKELLSIE